MKILRLIKSVILIAPIVIYYHLFYNIRFARHPERYPLEKRFGVARKEIRIALKLLKVDYVGNNMEQFFNLKEKALIISNHHSFIDPFLLIANSEKPITFIAKKETFKMPFVGKIAKSIEVFPLDRKNIMNQLKTFKEVVNYLKDPNKPSVIVYIEGTRNRHPENVCGEFHPGTLKFAQMAGVPLVSIACFGNHRVLSTKSYLKHNLSQYTCLNVYSPEYLKSKSTTELALELKKEIDDEIDSLRKKDIVFIDSLKISEKKKKLEKFVDQRVLS